MWILKVVLELREQEPHVLVVSKANHKLPCANLMVAYAFLTLHGKKTCLTFNKEPRLLTVTRLQATTYYYAK